jgi:hypothetical protein
MGEGGVREMGGDVCRKKAKGGLGLGLGFGIESVQVRRAGKTVIVDDGGTVQKFNSLRLVSGMHRPRFSYQKVEPCSVR